MSTLKRTPLFDFHKRHGGRIVPFAGWELPVQYTGILDEHRGVRKAAGLFDVSHMGEVHVDGPGAVAFVQHLLCNDMGRLKPGKAIYSPMCYEDGGCVDDVICYMRTPENLLVVVNAANVDKDFAWMQEHVGDFDCTLENRSDDYAQLALQGPKAWEILAALDAKLSPDELGRFTARESNLAGVDVLLSRTGYTGEDGAELYCRSGDAETLAEALWEAGQPRGLVLAGLGARDSLRLEAGFPLYGHEISPDITPLQAGLGWTVKLDKGSGFIGRNALRREKEEGVTRKVLHFTLEGRRIARDGMPVFWNERPVGEILSGSFSPIIEKPIGSMIVEAAAAGESLSVDFRGTFQELLVQRAPLHKAQR